MSKLPDKEPAVTPPLPMVWRCQCGRVVLMHHEYCPRCLNDRPTKKEE